MGAKKLSDMTKASEGKGYFKNEFRCTCGFVKRWIADLSEENLKALRVVEAHKKAFASEPFHRWECSGWQGPWKELGAKK